MEQNYWILYEGIISATRELEDCGYSIDKVKDYLVTVWEDDGESTVFDITENAVTVYQVHTFSLDTMKAISKVQQAIGAMSEYKKGAVV